MALYFGCIAINRRLRPITVYTFVVAQYPPPLTNVLQTKLEVQMIAVDVVHVTEIQQFITFADPYETVGGFWSLSYPGKKP